MPAKLYHVKLTQQERQELKELTSKGKTAARKQNHARILSLCDENSADGSKKDAEITAAPGTSRRSVGRVRQRFVEEGLQSAINPKPGTRHRLKKRDGAAEAFFSCNRLLNGIRRACRLDITIIG